MKAKTRWKMRVLYLDSCNCAWGCPCQFNAKPTNGNCEGLSAIHIKNGNSGAVKLDGLNLAWVGTWPGPIHEGHGKASYYIDERANDAQFEALSKIITGRAGGGPFEIYASTIDDFREPRRARIIFQAKGLRSLVKVDGVGEVRLEPMRNPVTGKIHRAIIELPTGFESIRTEVSSTEKLIVDDGYLNFRYAGTYGSFQETEWKGL